MPKKTSKTEYSKLVNMAIIDLAQSNNYYQDSKYRQARTNLLHVVAAMDRQAGILANHV